MKSACIACLVLSFAFTALAATNPIPFVNAPLAPSSVAPGSAGFELTVNGSGFVAGAVVNWNGAALPTTYVNTNVVTASVPAGNVAASGTAAVTVSNPAPGGGSSNVAAFTVTAPLGTLTFSATSYSVGNSLTSVIATDLNHDGKADLALVNQNGTDSTCFPGNGTSTVSVLTGNGDGTFTNKWNYDLDCILSGPASFTGFNVLSGDFNNDGKPDLLVVYRLEGLYSAAIFLGVGDGTFTYFSSYPGAADGFDSLNSVTLGDFNGDGKLDFTFTYNDLGYSSVLAMLGNGDGTFSFSFYSDYLLTFSLAAGDFNRDGILDLANGPALSSGGPDTPILLGHGDGTFVAAPSQPSVAVGSPVITADFNGDGLLDLAFNSGNDTSSLTVLLGNGDGTFVEKTTQAVGQNFSLLSASDLNADGKLDLVVDNLSGTGVSVLLGNGDGTFQSQLDYGVEAGPLSIAAADLDGDGRLDLVTANGDASYTVLLNTSARTVQAPYVSLSTTNLAFGTQTIGTVSLPQTVTLTNTGNGALLITGLGIAGVNHVAFAQTNNCGSTVAAGASCTITVSFKPNGRGPTAATLMILDNANSTPQRVTLSGAGTFLQLSAQSVNFGSQSLGTRSAPHTITLSNMGSAAVNFTGIGVSGPNVADFYQTNSCGGQIAAGSSCSVVVTFKPAVAGTRTGEVVVNHDGGGSPMRVALSGTGI